MRKRFFYFFSKRYVDLFRYLMVIASIGVIVWALPKAGRFKYEFRQGRVWPNKTLVAPFDFPIEKDKKDIEREESAIIHGAIPYYTLLAEVEKQTLEKYTKDFNERWQLKNGRQEKFKKQSLEFGLHFLHDIYSKGILQEFTNKLSTDPDAKIYIVNEDQLARKSLLSEHIIQDSVLVLLKRASEERMDIDYNVLLTLISNIIQPNLIYNEELSQKALNEQLEMVSITKGLVRKGEKIIEKEELVDSLKYRIISSLKNEHEKRQSAIGNHYYIIIGQIIMATLVMIILMVFLSIFRKDIYADNRRLFLILSIITGMILVLSWAIKSKVPSLYFIPYCIVPIIVRVLFDTRLALNIHIMVVIMAGFFVPNGFEFVFLQTTAGMISIYTIKNLMKRSQLLVSACILFAYYIVAFAGINLLYEGRMTEVFAADNILPFVSSVTLTLLAYPFIYIFEKIFGITTELSLMELTNTNNKLLRELSFKAPGTFQHSLQVANLAESAIFEIGGNSLLIRAGALYHDIGKMDKPEYFIENQTRGYNPHDEISYEESAAIIIRHVTQGIEMARKEQLPQEIINFIRTHHGNTRVDYFYRSFLKNFPEKIVNENHFRYPGPIPFSREMAVLMLADSVEAASRSLKNPSPENIESLVDQIIDGKLAMGQLANSDLSLKDLTRIRKIFKKMLMGIYHVRIDYEIE